MAALCYLQNIVMERREDDVVKMRLPDKHTGGQTDTGRSCSYVPLSFTGNAKKSGNRQLLQYNMPAQLCDIYSYY